MDECFGRMKVCRETEYEVEVNWEMENFLSSLDSALCETSPPFIWASITWELKIYHSVNDIQLYLYKRSHDKILPIVFKFGIKLIDGTIEFRCSLSRNFDCSENHFGTIEFIRKSELVERKYELLHARMLTISCLITHRNTLTNPQNIKYEDLEVYSSNFKALYGSIESSDMTIIVGEHTRYPVHTIILAARSDVFSSMFKHDMEEVKSGIIKISDCDPASFNVFLLYLYTGKVEKLSSGNVCHLYNTADKYNVQELKHLCVRYMKRNLSVAIFFDIVMFANQFEETELIPITQEFFKRNALEIIKRNDWEQFLKQEFTVANQLLISMLEKIKIDD